MRNRGSASKAKASDRSYIPTDEEAEAFIEAAMKGSPTSAAILGASFVEFTLELAIQHSLEKDDDETWSHLTSDNGPLATFNQKILLGFALGIYDKDLFANLKIIKDVRNKFAHPRKQLDFATDPIPQMLKRAVVPNNPSKERQDSLAKALAQPPSKEVFVMLCLHCVSHVSWNMRDISAAKQKNLELAVKSSEQKFKSARKPNQLALYMNMIQSFLVSLRR